MDTTGANDNGNGRVTLALVGAKVDGLVEDVKELGADMKATLKAQEERIRALEAGQVKRQEQIDTLQREQKCTCADVEYLKKRDFWGTFLSGFLAAGAAIIAWFK